jgi:hypothetical protein
MIFSLKKGYARIKAKQERVVRTELKFKREFRTILMGLPIGNNVQ